MMIKYNDFPVRPTYLYGESLTSFVYRIYSANGHNLTYSMSSELGEMCGLLPENISLAQFDHVSAALSPLCSFSAIDWLAGRMAFQKVRSTRLRRDHLKFCPQCMRSHHFHLNLWELPLFNACPVHGTKLLMQCENCGHPLKWSRLRPHWKCACGMSMYEMTPEPTRSADSSLAALILDAADAQVPWRQSASNRGANAELPLDIIYKLLERFHELRLWITVCVFRGLPPSDLPLGNFWIRTSPHQWECRLLNEWPKGLHASILRLSKRFWQKETVTFISLHRNCIVLQALQRLTGDGTMTPENKLIYQAIRQLLDQELAPLSVHNTVIFNPRLTAALRRHRLCLFHDWWITRYPNDANHVAERPARLNFPSSRIVAEEAIVDTINALIKAAESQAQIPRAVDEFLNANGINRIPVSANHETFLRTLSTALLTVPHAHLLRMTKDLSGA